MSDDQVNPYAAPQVESLAASDFPGESEDALYGLGPRSVLLMILLTVLTLGLYINFWTHRLATTLNQGVERRRISMGLVAAFWVLSVTSLLWIVPEIITDDDPEIVRIGELLTRSDMFFTIIMAFAVRSGLNTAFRVLRTHEGWFHGLWTFLFGIYYLQWKINRNLRWHDLSPQTASQGPTLDFEFLSGDQQR